MSSQRNTTSRSITANYLEEAFITDGNSFCLQYRTRVAISWPHFKTKIYFTKDFILGLEYFIYFQWFHPVFKLERQLFHPVCCFCSSNR